jgi:beta-N-acetylhexosaminidase
MVLSYGYYAGEGSEEYGRLSRLVTELQIGGVVCSHGDVYETLHLLNRLQMEAKVPLLVSADLERGLAMRIRRGTPFPDAMMIGATRDTALARRVGWAIAREARALGIHQNYAPVADVNSNPANPVINTRAFGGEAELVSGMVSAFVRGTQEGGLLATVKHFPGHGDTEVDSHLSLPLLPLTRERLDSVELAPFRASLAAGVRSVMVSHINVPALEPSAGLPSSLSARTIEGLLRREMGFTGLVVTDAMEMQGVVRGFSVGESTVQALKAGVDAILLPVNPDLAVSAIVNAVRRGGLSMERLDAAVRKILLAKERLGLGAHRWTDPAGVDSIVGAPAHWQLAREVARKGITLLRDERGVLPLQRSNGERIASIVLTDTEDGRADIHRSGPAYPCEPVGAYLQQLLGRRVGAFESVRLTPGSGDDEFDRAIARVRRADLLLLQLFVKVRTSSGRIGIPERYRDFLAKVEASGKKTVVLLFGNPYLAARFPRASTLFCAYGDTEPQIEAAVEALCGEIPVGGKLPVSIAGEFSYGSGIRKEQSVLRKDVPLAAGFDPERLRGIDSIVYRGIRDSAFSAAQVAVVKDGMLVWSRAYGTYTYDPASREIGSTEMFDLASVTKVIATTSAIMKLVDGGRVNLEDPVSRFIPAFASGEKRGITIRHLLLHRSGFPPFRKFWEFCPDSTAMLDSVFATPLVARPGDTTIYSDLGFITLGAIVERVSGVSLSAFVQREFFGPLRMRNTMYTPPFELRSRTVPTEFDSVWRHRLVQGTVHDENAQYLGGVSGHAGLFSSATDLAVFMQMLLNGGEYNGVRYLSAATIDRFVRSKEPGQERFLGWDRKSARGSSAGSLFSPSSFGHTGFTGTSIWADPERKLAVVFLTNRVHPTRANGKLSSIRPALHDLVISSLR